MDPLRGGRLREAESLLVLEALPGLGHRGLHSLLRWAGSAEAVLARSGLLENRVGPEAAASARSGRGRASARAALEEAERMGMAVMLWTDPRYPPALHRLSDPPPLLFLRGDTGLLSEPGVGVVGARKATSRARDVARSLGAGVARGGTAVVSGMALGVDGEAHRGALSVEGPTVAVLGRGADRAYPASHRRLFRRIVERGLVVSEFAPGTPARPHHFPRRNRVLAALSGTVVVVEAGARSGALITVDHALDLGVEVWAVPGPIGEPATRGSNGLLADGARPLVAVASFLDEVVGAPQTCRRPARIEGPEARVLDVLAHGGMSADEVARATGMPPGRVLALLAALELGGRVRRLPGLRFRRAG